MAYDNTNRGTIAKNTRKSKDTDADLAGSINVEGVEYWLNGWQKKNGKDGSTFYSLSVKPKQARREPDDGDMYGYRKEEMDDEIPF